jgi:HNH endonuclease
MKTNRSPRGDRSAGLFAPPRRFWSDLDRVRNFSRAVRRELRDLHMGCCSNPFCDSPGAKLQVHHIYAHSLGGKSVINNAVILCETCHSLVHRGVVPLTVILDWKRNLSKALYIQVADSDSDELLHNVRSVPISNTLTSWERLICLNTYLSKAQFIRQSNIRNFILGQVMLAKAAVLNDSYRDVRDSMELAVKAMRKRYRKILPFGASAVYFGKEVNSPAIMVRALHYRSIAYETCGNLESSLKALLYAKDICKDVSPHGDPSQFHELSTPARIIRAIAIVRAKLNSQNNLSEREYKHGLQLDERYGSPIDLQEAQIRFIQLRIALGKYSEAERDLDGIWDNQLTLAPNAKAIAYRLRIELLLRRKANVSDLDMLIDNALREATWFRLYRQEHHLHCLRDSMIDKAKQ